MILADVNHVGFWRFWRLLCWHKWSVTPSHPRSQAWDPVPNSGHVMGQWHDTWEMARDFCTPRSICWKREGPDCEGRGPKWFHFWRKARTKKRKETDPPGNRLTFSKDHPRGLNCGRPGETRKLSPIQLLTLKLRSWILIKNSSLKNINCLLFRVLSEAVPQGLRMNCYYFRVVGAEVEVGKRSRWGLLALP